MKSSPNLWKKFQNYFHNVFKFCYMLHYWTVLIVQMIMLIDGSTIFRFLSIFSSSVLSFYLFYLMLSIFIHHLCQRQRNYDNRQMFWRFFMHCILVWADFIFECGNTFLHDMFKNDSPLQWNAHFILISFLLFKFLLDQCFYFEQFFRFYIYELKF